MLVMTVRLNLGPANIFVAYLFGLARLEGEGLLRVNSDLN